MISVIIPCFNSSHTILRAIDSVMSQTTIENIKEIIIVDDCSTDKTMELVKNLNNSLIRIIELEVNSGSAASPRNAAILACSGEFIAFLDSDDSWCENHLESTFKVLQNGSDLVCTNAHKVINTVNMFPYFKLLPSRRIHMLELLFHNPIIMSSVLCRKKIFIDNLIFFTNSSSKNFYNDYLIWYKITTYYKVIFLNKITLKYFISSKSDSSLYIDPISAERTTFNLFMTWARNKKGARYLLIYKLIYFLKEKILY
jgi:glycosyltransferase involved in cell wall biosynthesis